MTKLTMLLVRWIDARKADKTFYLAGFEAQRVIHIETIGWGIVKEDEVCLAQDFYPLEEGDLPGDENVRTIEIIPRQCIQEIVYLMREMKPNTGSQQAKADAG